MRRREAVDRFVLCPEHCRGRSGRGFGPVAGSRVVLLDAHRGFVGSVVSLLQTGVHGIEPEAGMPGSHALSLHDGADDQQQGSDEIDTHSIEGFWDGGRDSLAPVRNPSAARRS